jgi:3-methyladenine DNA glycosylase AlkD
MPRPVSPSAVTQRANAFVEAHEQAARSLGTELAELVDDPEAFVTALLDGLQTLAYPEYLVSQRYVAPILGESIGVRLPLLTAVRRGIDRGTRRVHPDSLLWLANRLFRSPILEIRVINIGLLTRLLPSDPERTWQLLRQVAAESADWITVDTLAHAYGAGILLDARRWAEIEQLAYSSSPWERRLVGSTIATIPFVNRTAGRAQAIAGPSLDILGTLIGDADPTVQKALSWALRSVALVDRNLVAEFCDEETNRAVATDDGQRAWVIRDALQAIDPSRAAAIHARLDGIRRRPGAASTSRAALAAARFSGAGFSDPRSAPDPTIGARP